ncbi:hypothetical protein GH5_06767 [Leishmania sp. Ghana 2012 LV757]|uniref:hypothetical protein n=1 Tax=Leishmania sp. Ghana 2012 LV757 TaxID=2803181 RepID=UPI001B59582A|nr:hypothetical protein GH5_06767 [Leishmania sp. Ghana 2012 LV757]
MDGRLVQTSCRTTEFSAVEATLREWPDVEAVGSFREKRNNMKDITTVFVTFRDEAAAKAAKAKLDAIPGIAGAATTLSASPKQDKAEPSSRQSKRAQKKGKAGGYKNLAAEFLRFESHRDQKQREVSSKKKNHVAPEGAGVQAARRGRGRHGAGRGTGERGGRGGGFGECGENRSINNDYGRGAGVDRPAMRGRIGAHLQPPEIHLQPQPYQPPPRLPPFEANVAFVDNVPFGTTNRYLMERFSAFGRILDVNRLELMVMICFDNPESVQQCIQHMNGTKIHDNVITVSSGTIRIPGSVAIQMGV